MSNRAGDSATVGHFFLFKRNVQGSGLLVDGSGPRTLLFCAPDSTLRSLREFQQQAGTEGFGSPRVRWASAARSPSATSASLAQTWSCVMLSLCAPTLVTLLTRKRCIRHRLDVRKRLKQR